MSTQWALSVVAQAAKDWGWREFVTLTSLFDIDAGFLVNDAVVFSAEVCCRPYLGCDHCAGRTP